MYGYRALLVILSVSILGVTSLSGQEMLTILIVSDADTVERMHWLTSQPSTGGMAEKTAAQSTRSITCMCRNAKASAVIVGAVQSHAIVSVTQDAKLG